MKLRRVALVALTLASVVGLASAQTPTAKPIQKLAPVQPPQLQAAVALKLQPVTVPPQLQSVIAQKAEFDPAKLKGKLTYVGNVPQLQVRPTRKVLLEPVNETPPAYAPIDPALKTQLTKYKPHYAARYFGKARPPLTLEKIVHHKQWQTPIRDQGNRGTCVAFASLAGIEWFYKRFHGQTRDLSENHAYNVFMSKVGSNCMTDPGLKTVDAADYLRTERVCEEVASPYVNPKASSCSVIPAACSVTKKHGIAIAAKFFAPAYGGTGDEVATNTSYLEALVNLGMPVVMGVHVAGTDWSDGSAESGVIDVQKTSSGQPAASMGGHAMLLVGYNSTSNYFIFKNSWGEDGGHDGYYHLSYEYMQTYAKYGYVILGTTTP